MGSDWEYDHGNGKERDRKSHFRTSVMTSLIYFTNCSVYCFSCWLSSSFQSPSHPSLWHKLLSINPHDTGRIAPIPKFPMMGICISITFWCIFPLNDFVCTRVSNVYVFSCANTTCCSHSLTSTPLVFFLYLHCHPSTIFM